jgi:hypothetical protein
MGTGTSGCWSRQTCVPGSTSAPAARVQRTCWWPRGPRPPSNITVGHALSRVDEYVLPRDLDGKIRLPLRQHQRITVPCTRIHQFLVSGQSIVLIAILQHGPIVNVACTVAGSYLPIIRQHDEHWPVWTKRRRQTSTSQAKQGVSREATFRDHGRGGELQIHAFWPESTRPGGFPGN